MKVSRIGESLLTRFASDVNKDLVCNYIKYLSPIQIVTDLHADPDDPAQWERGQMGLVHRDAWLQQRRRVIEAIATCYKDAPKNITMLVRAASQLNYMDVLQELLHIPVEKPFEVASGMRTWNVMYGPYRGSQYIETDDIVTAAKGMVLNFLDVPLRLLLDMYEKRIDVKNRDDIILYTAETGNLVAMEMLMRRLGKPDENEGKSLILHSVLYGSVDVTAYLFQHYEPDDAKTLVTFSMVRRMLPLYLAIPEKYRTNYDKHAKMAFESSLPEFLAYLRPFYHSFEWLNNSLNKREGFGDDVTKYQVEDTVKELFKHPDFMFTRDVDLLGLDPKSKRARAYLYMFLGFPSVRRDLYLDQLKTLQKKWRHNRALTDRIQLLIRHALRSLGFEEEPPAKLLKDPVTVTFYA